MIIYLMRHGEASFDALHDDVRPLTENGRLKITGNIREKQQELSQVKKFLSSPLLRAVQTAELTLNLLQRSDVLENVSWLLHESNPTKSIQALSELGFESVMLFSHQPFASRFVEILCDLPMGEIALYPASIVAVEAEPVAGGFGKVLWQLA